MSNYRRVNTKGGRYFFTVVSYRRQQILCHENVRKALRSGIRNVQTTHPFTIDGWVLLPDHLHCIWTLPPDDSNFSIRWAMIKRYVTKLCATNLRRNDLMNKSKRQRNESTLWQRRFWEHQIRDERDYQTHMDYIHYNPVKHRMVNKVMDWPHSTFHRYVRAGVYDQHWGGNGIGAIGQGFGE